MLDKSNDKMNSFKNNKKPYVFLLFLSMSMLFWTLIKLSKKYISEVEFNLVYIEVPKNKLQQEDATKTVKMTLKTTGFKMLRYGFEKKILHYSLSDIKHLKSTKYYSLTKTNINNLQAQLSVETDVLRITPDTLHFDLGIKKSKKVKVISNVEINFKPGYSLRKEYHLEPNFVTISGPEKIIDTISVMHTESINWTHVSQPFNSVVKLKKPNGKVSLSENEIIIKGDVVKITEGTFSLPFEVVNLPKGYWISTYPKEVKIIYQVALSDYNKISENSFVIQCDYLHTENNNLEYLIPTIVKKPKILFDVKIIPNKVEFLIKK